MPVTDLIEAVSRNLGDFVIEGQCASASGTLIASNQLVLPDGKLNGYEFYIYDGGGVGQAGFIGSHVGSLIYFTNELTPPPSINSWFMVLKSLKKGDYDNQINRAIGICKLCYAENMVATLAIIGTQYAYPVPSGFSYINRLRVVPSVGTDYSAESITRNVFELPDTWEIQSNVAGSREIVFDPRKINLANIDNRILHVEGQCTPDFTSATLPLRCEEFIVNKATAMLSTRNPEWVNLFAIYNQEAERMYPFIQTKKMGEKV